MIDIPQTVDLPIERTNDGVVLIRNTRITLRTLINVFSMGESIEAIHKRFETIPLSDIYTIIGYYLSNKEAIDAYVRAANEERERQREEWESRRTPHQKKRWAYLKKVADEKKRLS